MGISKSLIMFLLLFSLVNSIQIIWSDEELSNVEIRNDYAVLNGTDLLVRHDLIIRLERNYTDRFSSFHINIKPWELYSDLPSKNFEYIACDGFESLNLIDFSPGCNQSFKSNLSFFVNNHTYVDGNAYNVKHNSSYVVKITDFNSSIKDRFSVSISYVLPNRVQKQGMEYFIRLNYENFHNRQNLKSMTNVLLLENENQRPVIVDDDVDLTKYILKKQDGFYHYVWAYKFDGYGDRTFIFEDLNEIENTRNNELILGIILSSVLSALLGSIVGGSFLTSNYSAKTLSFNTTTKRIHLLSCSYSGFKDLNIYKKCKICFKNKK